MTVYVVCNVKENGLVFLDKVASTKRNQKIVAELSLFLTNQKTTVGKHTHQD